LPAESQSAWCNGALSLSGMSVRFYNRGRYWVMVDKVEVRRSIENYEAEITKWKGL